MKDKKDILLALIIGEICGLLMFYIVGNLATENISIAKIVPFAKYLPLVFPLICAVGMFLVNLILPSLQQVAKFVLVGGTNFLIDQGIFNVLIFATGISVGWKQSVFKGLSFTVAVINSYFWNKFWVFKRTRTETAGKEFMQFVVVSIVGFLINIGLDKILVDGMGPIGSIKVNTWAQIAAAVSAIVVLFWNFAGYKFIVFDSNNKATENKNGQPSAL